MDVLDFIDDNPNVAIYYYDPEVDDNPEQICVECSAAFPSYKFAYTLIPSNQADGFAGGKYLYSDSRPYFSCYKDTKPELVSDDEVFAFIEENTKAAILYYNPDDEIQAQSVCEDLEQSCTDFAFAYTVHKPKVDDCPEEDTYTYFICYEDSSSIDTPRLLNEAIN
ncbi:hypothetical protein GGH12_002150 [Coemansia sp. RSA 1822]|nr:hypothetical protein GGF49_003097 [Coemansia sp. RSA 1853]KAJ2564173.1 hypothetical protein GGH12_002150 [Coemansia sp. RSA 1822]